MIGDAGKRRVLAIGVSRFAEPGRHRLPFAAADAVAFAAAFRPQAAIQTLIDREATTTAVQGALQSLASAEPSDEVIVFAVLHSEMTDGEIRVTVHDGSVPLDEPLAAIWNGPARRVTLLLDLNRGAKNGPEVTSSLTSLCLPRPGRVLLLSDDGAQGSHVSGELQAGVWAHQVTAAFAGAARNSDGSLTVGSLNSFLAKEVPRSLARAYTSGRRQNPVSVTDDESELLDEPVSPEPVRAPGGPPPSPSAGLRFVSEVELPVKSLGGFRKSLHRPPTDTLASSRDWIARLAEPDLVRELEETLPRLRQHFGYKRKDLRADGPAGGAASVLTPDFTYHLSAEQHPGRPDWAILRRRLTEFRSIDVVGRDALSHAFPSGFSSLYQPFESPADVPTLIDAIEDELPAAVTGLDYPPDATHCDLELRGFDGRVRIVREGLTVTAATSESPAVLAGHFALVKRILQTAGS